MADTRTGEHADIVSILRAIRADQVTEARDRNDQHRDLTRAIAEQGATVNRLASDLAGLCFRTASIEAEQQRHAVTIGLVKERQDSCAARITHAEDSTEIRDIRTQLQKAVNRHYSTPPQGTRTPRSADSDGTIPGWLRSRTGKAILTAVAGLLMALLGMVAPWSPIGAGAPPEVTRERRAVLPSRSVPPDYQGEDSDLGLAPDTSDARRGRALP